MNNLKEADIVDRCLLTLEKITGFHTISLNRKNIDFPIDYGFDGSFEIKDTTFLYSIKFNPKPKILINEYQKEIKVKNYPFIYILEYATPSIIQILKENNINFIDTSGNCFINHKTLFLFIKGNAKRKKASSLKKAFKKTGLKIIFYFLANPNNINSPYRTIAIKTETSLTSVSDTIEELKQDGFILKVGNNQNKLHNVKKLIQKWTLNYEDNLRPHIHRGNFKPIKPNFWELKKWVNNVYISGELAGAYLTNFLKPKTLTIYTNKRISTLAKEYNIVPSNDSDSTIEVLEVFWDDSIIHPINSLYQAKGLDMKYFADPVITYADLMKSNNYRNFETAERLLNNEIRNKFNGYNLQW